MPGACQGLLGDARAFKAEYVKPITAGSDKHATQRSRSLAAGRAADLRARFAPFFLRREKQAVLGGAARWGSPCRLTCVQVLSISIMHACMIARR